MGRSMKSYLAGAGFAALCLLPCLSAAAVVHSEHDVLIVGGTIYDGTGGQPYVGDIAIDGDRITYVGPRQSMHGKRIIDALGKAVSPGFINMLSHVEESLLIDGRALSDLSQGVTLEVMGEGDSMGPVTDAMAKRDQAREGRHQVPDRLAHLRRIPG